MIVCSEEINKKFPSYFENFTMPEGASENEFIVYRACKTCNVDKQSFLCSYEENGYQISYGGDISNPSEYSLSTYEKPKDVKRFAITNSDHRQPFMIAKGSTNPIHGLSQRTRDRKHSTNKSSHIDWWIYEGAEPHKEFKMIEDFKKFFDCYRQESKNDKICKY